MLTLVLLIAGSSALFYFFIIKPFQHWSKKGTPQPSIGFLLKEIISGILQRKAQADIVRSSYDYFGDARYGGFYQFLTPTLYLRDPDLIKQITVKDFDHFVDHNKFISEEAEPLWGKNLFSLKGDRWRDMRATLSPSFTSSKMKAMFGLMAECSEQFLRNFENKNSTTVHVEFKDAFTRYANDIIASAAFGITCDSMKEPENEFYMMGKEATNFRGFVKNIKFLLVFIAPTLAKIIGLKMFSNEVSAFFRRLVKSNMESREKNGIIRPDMIHLLMEAKKGRLKHDDIVNGVIDTGFAVIEESSIGKEVKRQKTQLSDDDITAQALIFFFAGFESVSTLMCFAIYELALNADVQEKLLEEIDDTLARSGGTLTYEALLKMKYLDMVISETLRKWPAAIAVDRVCNKPYTIQPVNDKENPVKLDVGDVVWLPIFALHRDPNFYPDPDRFDPERFNDDNKSNINPYSYIPFGVGPRSCIGNRFALLETKTVIVNILSKFNITVIEKSPVPVRLAKDTFNLTSDIGFWFGLKPRKTKHVI